MSDIRLFIKKITNKFTVFSKYIILKRVLRANVVENVECNNLKRVTKLDSNAHKIKLNVSFVLKTHETMQGQVLLI